MIVSDNVSKIKMGHSYSMKVVVPSELYTNNMKLDKRESLFVFETF